MNRKKGRVPHFFADFVFQKGQSADQLTEPVLEALRRLSAEGKASLSRNLREVRKVTGLLSGLTEWHVACEEAVVFPYFEAHVPRLTSLIGTLKSEHTDFRLHLDCFLALLGRLPGKNAKERRALIANLEETGLYLVHLLRYHVHTEKETILKSYLKEFRSSERSELKRRIREYAGLP